MRLAEEKTEMKKVVAGVHTSQEGKADLVNPETGSLVSLDANIEGLPECLEAVPVDDLIRLKEAGFEPEGLVKLRKAGVL